ncbi:maleylpyruvate isomerase family mycothiol-dependent enzyme [Nocardioides sp.]|uniref:maleylpyruvate isomerase family mycothiol-dependent enzyme n=1 Tax=Nocardioides sp. TaxID=35761 RepID=UPI002733864E|nr:maleylpyruvate isomerase family mycothiol-dependent enzyme [Nocardioides sp.]MDP3889972.1 maleylpyruvate isomerase family mycothiol-dependent enzyme [Nocardioides sp.]
MSNVLPPLALLDDLQHCDERLLRTVDTLSDDDLRADSLLPGWSRAHVLAHIALNGEGLAGVLEGLAADRDEPMYRSDEARDADIEALSASPGPALRERLDSAATRFREAAASAPDHGWERVVLRTPGRRAFPAHTVVERRHREVEIHHADLDAGYSPDDWPADFLERTFREVLQDRRDGPPVQLRTPEDEAVIGDGRGPTVTGSRADVTWWLLGRGTGTGLTCDTDLPALGAWR